MIFGLDVESVLILVAAWLGGSLVSTVIVWKWIVPWFFGPYVRKTIVEMLAEPDEDTQQAVNGLVKMIFAVHVKTGKKITDDDGKEHEEEIDLLAYFGRYLSNFLLLKMKAARGGAMANARDGIQAELGGTPDLFGSIGPRKGQTSMEWIMEQAAPRLMPIIEKKVAEILEKKSF